MIFKTTALSATAYMIYSSYKYKKKGFTLIELLVVIAIIGLLATIVLVSLNSARAKARDVKRKGDLHQILLALELYYDAYGTYPMATGCYHYYYSCSTSSEWITGLGEFMTNLPIDPKGGCNAAYTGAYSYTYGNSTGNGFDLMALLENPNDPDRAAVKNPIGNCGHAWAGFSGQLYVITIKQ